MMAMLIMLEANLMLIPKDSSDGSQRKVSEDLKKVAVDLLLKASGLLDFCVHSILVNLPLQIRKDLPNYLKEGFLLAISIQAIAQGVEMQLGMALQCENVTLSVKRRLACEAVIYIFQVF
ncbi:hypothetical protein AXF42_Ash002664 [Apostasia shenzhenica]|uniref:Uncharacterized protein n=1 Tax=Apostasia shenzhenica TaxID=1088818 RepID=A0A2I0A6Y1_9ASPA|nr:hypothetical protein AXF42_Ash002664 [Apostasia shenzhenica]